MPFDVWYYPDAKEMILYRITKKNSLGTEKNFLRNLLFLWGDCGFSVVLEILRIFRYTKPCQLYFSITKTSMTDTSIAKPECGVSKKEKNNACFFLNSCKSSINTYVCIMYTEKTNKHNNYSVSLKTNAWRICPSSVVSQSIKRH